MPIIELTTSRTITYDQGNPVGIREFHVSPYDTEADIDVLINNGALLPGKFSLWPNAYRIGFPAVRIVMRDYVITRDPNVPRAWHVRFIYKDATREPTTYHNLQPNDDGYVTYRMSTEGRFVDMWRQWITHQSLMAAVVAKTDANYVPRYGINDSMSDIGGQKIDVAGTPTSVVVPIQRIIVDITTVRFPSMIRFNTYLGSKNKTIFLGCETATVVFMGADASEMQPGRWKVSLSFEVDKFFHLKQVPIRNASGYVELDQGGDTNALGRGQAARVAWVQPYPMIMDFKNIHPALANIRY